MPAQDALITMLDPFSLFLEYSIILTAKKHQGLSMLLSMGNN